MILQMALKGHQKVLIPTDFTTFHNQKASIKLISIQMALKGHQKVLIPTDFTTFHNQKASIKLISIEEEFTIFYRKASIEEDTMSISTSILHNIAITRHLK